MNIILSILKLMFKWALENQHISMITIDSNQYIPLETSFLGKLSNMLRSGYFYPI